MKYITKHKLFLGLKILAMLLITLISAISILTLTNAEDDFDFSNDFNSNQYTLNQVSSHDQINDCWIIVNNDVYDVTDFMDEDKAEKNLRCGIDNTIIYSNVFESITTISKYYIGKLSGQSQNTSTGTPQTSSISNQNNNPTGITPAIVLTHNTNTNCWVIVFDKVYDITSLIPNHPNIFVCGADNTAIYQSQHGTSVTRMSSYYVGNLATQTQTTGTTNPTQNTPSNTANNNSANQATNTTTNSGAVMIPYSYMSGYHNTASSCWVAISNKVYDITSLIPNHPNIFVCGADNTAIYQSQHGTNLARMSSYYVGELQMTTNNQDTSSAQNGNNLSQNNNQQNTTSQSQTIPYDYMASNHNTQTSCWISVSGKVYDITTLLSSHPNVFNCGADNTAIYQSQHGTSVARLSGYYIGELSGQNQNTTTTVTTTTAGINDIIKLKNQIIELENEISQYEAELAEIDSQKEQINFMNEKIKILEKKLLDLNINPYQEVGSKLNFSNFEDEDGDGVLNKNDMFPGENDYKKIDSDNDGISDYDDKFPGANDLEYTDSDNDGVMDFQDSDTTKDTDKDGDGIDDSVDTEDNRGIFAKILSMLGLNF